MDIAASFQEQETFVAMLAVAAVAAAGTAAFELAALDAAAAPSLLIWLLVWLLVWLLRPASLAVVIAWTDAFEPVALVVAALVVAALVVAALAVATSPCLLKLPPSLAEVTARAVAFELAVFAGADPACLLTLTSSATLHPKFCMKRG